MTYYAFHVPENSFVGTEVGAVIASDTDEGPNAELTYTFDSFSSGQMSHFIIDPDSGAITVASSDLDREKLSSYKAKIKVSDAGQPFYKSSLVEAVINIDDVNDNYPVFTRANYTIAMEEKTEIDTTLLVVVASDMDSDKNADVSYIMDPGMMDGSVAKIYFQVNTSSGVVSTKNIVTYENYQSFIFFIYAVDHGLPPLTGTTTLTIKILDINDNYPVFSPTFYNSEMAYNSQCEKIITQVTATDEDFGQNAAVSYFLQDETSQFLFQVDLLTGELGPVNIAPQHARFVLGVLARDAGTPIRSSKVPATVRVDTFNPDLYVITFRLAISRTAFFARVETFLNKLQHVVQTKFPSAIVRLWCVVEYDGVAQTTSGSRRRLLADQSVDVHLYALRDNTTDSAGNINKEKDFLKQDEFLSVVSANPQGDPGSNIQGDEWDYFGIVNVTPYHEEPKGWFDTDYGKAITAVAILLGLVLLAFWSYFLLICCSACVRRWKKRKSLAKKESEEKEFKERPKNEKFSLWHSGESVAAVSNSDDSEIHKKSVLPSYDGANEMNDTSKERNPSKLTHSQTDHDPAFSKSQHSSLLAYDFKKPVINLKKVKSETESDLSSWKWTIPRLMVVRKNSSDLSNSEDQSTSFEGKAHDRVSGKVYEYNTKTNQREWVN
ncbi:unnamed protein product [Lymnaea stagnalis]|uniref:Cadherin domain-containing protein n=1 Tax=Lymnaea stagnalis TaxID=6523 RepID=A0AAV2H2U7_LYMST